MKTAMLPRHIYLYCACLLCFIFSVASLHAQQPVVITNRYTGENIVFTNGALGLAKNVNDIWIIEKTGDPNFIRLKHSATGIYLNNEKGPLEASAVGAGFYSAQWTLKPVDGYMQILNRWKGTYLNNESKKLEATALGAPGWWSAQWLLKPAGNATPVPMASTGFYMIFGSDAQYPRMLDMTIDESARLAPATTQNNTRIASMNSLIDKLGNVKGLIENGDLTEYGNADQLDKFKQFHANLKVPTYPGLGNHDYSNNVNHTFNNHAANDMVDYMVDWYAGAGIKTPDYFRKTYYKFPENVTETTGSLSYSFDEGNVHFVQLNLEPYYERQWSDYVAASAKRKIVNITNSINWLKKDLALARNAGKIIILNFHDPAEYWGKAFSAGSDDAKALPDNDAYKRYDEFLGILNTYHVAAVFAGHLHECIGEKIGTNNSKGIENKPGPNSDASWRDRGAEVSQAVDDNYACIPEYYKQKMYGSVPLIFCGSGMTNKYILAKFDGNKMTISKVSCLNGGANIYSTKEYTVYNSKPATPLPIPSADGGVNASGTGCPEKTFRTNSDHSWAEFRLPIGAPGQSIKIENGAYNHYVFPKCNRVTWTDLEFKCGGGGTWEKTAGSWDADALCTNSKSASPYVATGDK